MLNSMDRRGVVIDVVNDSVKVLLQRHEACSSCKACKLGRDDGQETIVVAKNNAMAKKGDYVELSIASKRVASAAISAYGVPLLLIVLVMLIGQFLEINQGIVFLGIGFSLGVSYLINRLILEPIRAKANKYEVEAKKVVNSLEEAYNG